jgi:hypothetical protein
MEDLAQQIRIERQGARECLEASIGGAAVGLAFTAVNILQDVAHGGRTDSIVYASLATISLGLSGVAKWARDQYLQQAGSLEKEQQRLTHLARFTQPEQAIDSYSS